MSAPSGQSPGGGGRGFDKSAGRERRRTGTRSICTGGLGATAGDDAEQEREREEGVKYATGTGWGPERSPIAFALLLLLRCRVERAGEEAVDGARRGDEECLGGGVGGDVVHVGFGGEG